MNHSVALRRIGSDFRFRHVARPSDVPSSAESDVARIWQATVADSPAAHDGSILSVIAIGPRQLTACTVRYRYFAAQRAQPSLFETLRIRPLAVTGLIRVGDAFLFGRRSHGVAQERGAIELVPAGGVQPAAVTADGAIDIGAQCVAELAEEAGLRPPAGERPRPLALVDDRREHVVDIVCGLDLCCTESDLLSAYARAASDEYSEIFLIEPAALAADGEAWRRRMGAVTGAVVASSLWPAAAAPVARPVMAVSAGPLPTVCPV